MRNNKHLRKVRHGDVNLYPVDDVRGDRVDCGRAVTLAEGETTGHHHVLTVPREDDMTVLRTSDGTFYMTLKVEGELTHPEHGTLKVAPGAYRTGKEREVDHFAGSVVRKVID